MKLNERKSINPKSKKRVGRGDGSCGTFSGRGMKGQSARAGGRRRPGFEGGQTPLIRRMPKLRGFYSINRVECQVINLSDLEAQFNDGDKVTKETLVAKKLISSLKKPVKLLGNGEISKKIEITVDVASKSAIDKLEKANGKINIIKKAEKAGKKAMPKKIEGATE